MLCYCIDTDHFLIRYFYYNEKTGFFLGLWQLKLHLRVSELPLYLVKCAS